MKIGELFVSLGLDSSKLDSGLAGAGAKMILFEQTIRAVGRVFEDLVGKTLDYVNTLDRLQKTTGINIDEFQKWEMQANLNRVSSESLSGAIKSLNKARVDFTMGKGNLTPFALLGIDPQSKPFEVLEQLRTKVKNMEPSMALNILGQLGINEDMLVLFKSSNEQWDKFNQNLLLTKKERDYVTDLNNAWTLFKMNMTFMTHKFVASISPALTSVFGMIENLIKAYEKLSKIESVATALKVLGAGIAALIAYLNPVVATVGAVLAVFEDLYLFFTTNGEGSVSLWILQQFEKLEKVILSVLNQLAKVRSFGDLWNTLFNVDEIKQTLGFGEEKQNIGLSISGGIGESMAGGVTNNISNSITVPAGTSDPVAFGTDVARAINSNLDLQISRWK